MYPAALAPAPAALTIRPAAMPGIRFGAWLANKEPSKVGSETVSDMAAPNLPHCPSAASIASERIASRLTNQLGFFSSP